MSYIDTKSKTATEINNRIAAVNHDEQTEDIKAIAEKLDVEPSPGLYFAPDNTGIEVPVPVNKNGIVSNLFNKVIQAIVNLLRTKVTSVESIADLPSNALNGDTVYVKSYYAGKGIGGGTFKFNSANASINDKGLIINGWERQNVTEKSVTHFGAVGDGVTDDTAAIKAAVAAYAGNMNFVNSGNPVESAFITLNFPAVGKGYRITDTIYIPPYMRFKGESSRGGSVYGNNTKPNLRLSVIIADFASAENYKWAISTLNYVRATGQIAAWDEYWSGSSYDSGVVTGSFGSSLEDLVVRSGSNRVYGGVKMIQAPQCSIINCYIEGFDVAVLSSGSWDSRFEFGSVSYKSGFAAYGDMNNCRVGGYFHVNKNSAPLSNQLSIFNNDGTSGADTTADKRIGIMLKYAYGFSMENVIAEYWDMGIFVSQSTGWIGSYYSEANVIGLVAVATRLSVESISGVRCDYSTQVGSGADLTIENSVPDNFVTSFVKSISEYAVAVKIPKNIQYPLTSPKVFNEYSRLYVNSTTGSDSNSGLNPSKPLATVTTALQIIQKNQATGDITQSTSLNSLKRTAHTIIITDSADYTLSTWAQNIVNKDITIETTAGSNPKIISNGYTNVLRNSNLRINKVNLKRTYTNSWISSQAMFALAGKCEVTISNCNIEADYPLLGVNSSSDSSDLTVTMLGCTGVIGSTGALVDLMGSNKATLKSRIQFDASSGSDPSVGNARGIINIGTSVLDIVTKNLANNTSYIWTSHVGTLLPSVNNTYNLGSSNFVWSNLYVQTAPIVVSDERHKSEISAIPDEVLEAWGEVDFSMYKINAAIDAKGDDARFHFGVIAQRIVDIFESKGIDWTLYGIVTKTEWEHQPAVEYKAAEIDEEGKVISPEIPASAEVEGGDIYMVRYEECMILEMAYQRKKIKELLAK